MAKFNIEQAVAFAAVQELINEWAHDLDMHNGLHVADLVTDDCIYGVGDTQVHGRAGVEKNYRDRLARLSANPQGVPTLRHIISNLCVTFRKADEVSITFSLVFFTTAAGSNVPDPAAVADVRMECRKDAGEDWRIAKFDSNQPFRRG